MARQGGTPGMGRNVGQRPLTVESVVKVAVVAAVVVNLVNFLLFAIESGLEPNTAPDLFQVLVRQLPDVLYHTVLFGAVVAAYLQQQTQRSLAQLAGLVFGAQIAARIFDTMLFSILNPVSQQFDFVSMLFGGLTSAVYFLGFVMALRLFQRQTILPGVEFRV